MNPGLSLMCLLGNCLISASLVASVRFPQLAVLLAGLGALAVVNAYGTSICSLLAQIRDKK